MGRIRTVKPDFFLSEDLAQHPPLTRLLFLGLLTLADCDGRLGDRPKRIKVQVLPYDECDVDEALDALASTGQIVRYEVEGERFLEVCAFRKHQRLSGKEAQADSLIPGPSKGTILCGKHRGSTEEAPDVQERKGKEGKGREGVKDSAPAKPVPKSKPSLEVIQTQAGREAFERVWNRWPAVRPDGNRAKGHRIEAERAFQGLLNTKAAALDELERAAYFYLEHHPNVKAGFIAMVATFYGPKKGLWMETVRHLRILAEQAQATGTEGRL